MILLTNNTLPNMLNGYLRPLVRGANIPLCLVEGDNVIGRAIVTLQPTPEGYLFSVTTPHPDCAVYVNRVLLRPEEVAMLNFGDSLIIDGEQYNFNYIPEE